MKIRKMLCLMLGLAMLLCGCAPKTDSKKNTDYSAYDFAQVDWVRQTEGDTETLCFRANGEYRYSCACGSPVDDADLVDSYTYDASSKTFTLHYCEDMPFAITKIKLLSCDGDKLELDFAGEVRVFYKELIPEETTEAEVVGYTVDLTKVSPMILEITQPEVITAAQEVIRAFLQYENRAAITVTGNTQRFMNDMAYVIHCTCPMFGAFTDFNEMTAYDSATESVSWNFVVDQPTFDEKLQQFREAVQGMLSCLNTEDSEAMRAMLLYHGLIEDLTYDQSLLGDNFNLLSTEEANYKSSPYCVLVEKSGICTNIAQAYLFLCTQADLTCGTVLHTGGAGMHMWNVLQIDGLYYYCDPTWDADASGKYFGMTVEDRAGWAGGYSALEGSMLGVTIPEAYEINDTRFAQLREKLPVEISAIEVDKQAQTIAFVGYEYQYVFACME